MLQYFLIIFLLLVIFHFYLKFSYPGKIVDKIPGPTALPIIGNNLQLNLPLDKVWEKIFEFANTYYPIFRLAKGLGATLIFLRHPDDLKTLLSCKKNIKKGIVGYEGFDFCQLDGLIFNNGEKWHQRRKLLNPAFNPTLLKVYLKIIHEHSLKLTTDLKSGNKETTLDLRPFFVKFILAVVCESIMGVDLNKIDPKLEESFRHAIDDITEISFWRTTRPYVRDWMMRFLSNGRRQIRAVKTVSKFVYEIVNERRKYQESVGGPSFQEFVDDVDSELGFGINKGNRKRLAVLDLLLAAEKDGLIDKVGIEEEVDIFIAAGYDTTSLTTSYLLMLLAEDKEAQKRVRQEVSKVLDGFEGEAAMNEIQKLNYLDRCVKEALRLFPPAPMIGRTITDELHLKHGILPKGVEAGMHLYALHRDPNFWPEPNKFDPDRFLPENVQSRHPFAYLPFSAGLRNCIGKKFAMMNVKMAIAYILYDFHLEPVDLIADLRFQLDIILRPSHPIRAKFIRIDKSS